MFAFTLILECQWNSRGNDYICPLSWLINGLENPAVISFPSIVIVLLSADALFATCSVFWPLSISCWPQGQSPFSCNHSSLACQPTQDLCTVTATVDTKERLQQLGLLCRMVHRQTRQTASRSVMKEMSSQETNII